MAEKKIIEVDVKTGKGFDDLKTKVEGVKKETNKTSEATQKLGSKLDSVTGGAVSKFKGMVTAIKSVNTGFDLMKLAIIGTGIGALLIAILAVKKAFEASEEGQNKYAKILAVIGSVTGNLMDLLTDLGELIISVFEDPKKAINNFANLIKDNIVNRFNGLLELIPQLGAAVQKLFEGDFSGAAKTATNAVAKVTLGVDDLSGSIDNARKKLKELSDEVADDAKKAANIADNRAKADKLERDLIVERANANRKIADLRDKANNRELFSAQERIQFLKEASKISEDITDKEIKGAELRRDALILENTLSKSNKEALEAEEQSKARVIDLDTQKLRLQKALTAQIQSLNSEATSANNARLDEGKKELDEQRKKAEEERKKAEEKINQEIKDEQKRQDAINALREEFRLANEERDAETELEKIELFRSRDLAELERLNATEEQKAEVIKFWENEIANERENIRLQDLESEKAINEQKIRNRQMVINAISQFANAETGIGKALLIAKQALAFQETLMDLKRITFKGAQAIGEAGVATAGNVAQSSKIGFPQNLITIAAAIGQGVSIISSVKKAVSKTKAQATGISASVPSIASVPNLPQAQEPSFNIVGQSSTDQLAGAIGGQEKQPLKAYVVSEDVTTAQQLDRNIIGGATI